MTSPLPNNIRSARLVGLPSNPRAQRQMLHPLDTNQAMGNPTSTHNSYSTLDQNSTTNSSQPYTSHEKPTRAVFIDPRVRNADSAIFANATIPLSPTTSSTDGSEDEDGLDGLAPRRRNALARLFCCFGRDERARRRFARDHHYEKVGGDLHWSEY
ncbi:hypothetical protein K504DRAFT_461698 [Pleomassaria siparia CBS 279.74]|uniref:Uncharacterized protein n=1 Tax=Pleomassaria siparia CBS 279.74 TaxID=1314801 RepID=A0A6G1KL78_9PLEO|nr:hypothetical protein K504DRAFT_461698 [Pleomassaria siparia CBS 279.74]